MKEILKNKKGILCMAIALLIIVCISGYFIYENNRKNEIINTMSMSFTDVKEIEYGIKDFDIKKELIKEIKNANLVDIPKIDVNKIGEVSLEFTLNKNDVTKVVNHKIKVVDTKAPEIVLKTDYKELTIGEEYSVKDNITSVKDIIDGDIACIEDAKNINEKASNDYLKLKKDDIDGETRIGEHQLDEFFIEITSNKETKEETATVFLKNCYYMDGSVDTRALGEYKVKVFAVDKNGVKAMKEFTVIVKEKEAKKAPSSNSGRDTSSNSSSSSNRSSDIGSKSDIVNLALAQVGKAYGRDTAGPNSFDCSGLIYYVYTQNGWSIPRNTVSDGTRIAYKQLQPGDIVYMPSQNHVMFYIGNGSVIEAKNENTGVISHYLYGVQPDWQYIRY